MGGVKVDRNILSRDFYHGSRQVANGDPPFSPQIERSNEGRFRQFLRRPEDAIHNVADEAELPRFGSRAQNPERRKTGIFNGTPDEDGNRRTGREIVVLVWTIGADDAGDRGPQ